MDLGIFLPQDGSVPVAAAARRAEDAGLGSVWIGDHLAGGPILDAGMVLATAAAVTERVRIGFGVFLPALRPVAWAAKQVATLSVLGEGRFDLGVGIGGIDGPDWSAAGVPFGERAARTDDFLEVLPALLRAEATTVGGGRTVTLEPAVTPPPVWVGGGAKPALRRVARHGDGWLASLQPPKRLREHSEYIAEHAQRLGRPVPRLGTVVHGALVARSEPGLWHREAAKLARRYSVEQDEALTATIAGTPAEVAEQLAGFIDVGVERLAFVPHEGWTATCDLLAEVGALLDRG
ncbi:LLM class flavin-dependent oxidoreductase [Actinokineospora sp. PR83]|uniref:LLM class flavin-dependent oxidoreductase n=1 Tax=Actinokineospora sp. PR83 TaxID=2884908 RepID=UPI001F19336B|nr:LLM class flavin-dependent oxidoreductase [Actinokineospora sp. PR83]MCG8916954.1 LLM class flavin-dependent oxidoreductase [Actinokineospora sp. PR83]